MLDYASSTAASADLPDAGKRQSGVRGAGGASSVSEHTIRRDLHELSREGFCKGVWRGGAESAGSGGLQSAER